MINKKECNNFLICDIFTIYIKIPRNLISELITTFDIIFIIWFDINYSLKSSTFITNIKYVIFQLNILNKSKVIKININMKLQNRFSRKRSIL